MEPKNSPSKFCKIKEVEALIQRKYYDPSDLRIDREIFLQGIAALRPLAPCIWCSQPRVSGELLRLLSFPDNECKTWFCDTTRASLSSCPDCLEAYYTVRCELKKAFSKLYEKETLRLFWGKVSAFEISRIREPFQLYLKAALDAKSPTLIFALYELLLFPDHLQNIEIHREFTMVLSALVTAKKMIKVNRLLPGIFVCLFDSDPSVRNWAIAVLEDGKIESVESFIPESLDLIKLVKDVKISKETMLEGLLRIIRWMPKMSPLNERWFMIQNLIAFLQNPSSLEGERIISGINKSLKEKSLESAHEWSELVTALMDYFKKDLVSKRPLELSKDLYWIESLRQWSISNKTTKPIAKLIDRLAFFGSVCEGDFAIYNLLSITSILFSGEFLAVVADEICQDTFRLLSVCFQRVSDVKDFKTSIIEELVDTCFEIDQAILCDPDEEGRFRGFAQLLSQMLKCRNLEKICQTQLLKKLSSQKSLLHLWIEKRSFLISVLVDVLSFDVVAKSEDFMQLAILFSLFYSSKDLSLFKSLFQSYPERFIYAFKECLSPANTGGNSYKECSEALKIYKEVFVALFYTDSKSSVVDFFPDALKLKETILLIGLRIVGMYFQSIKHSNVEKPHMDDIVSSLQFVAEIYLKHFRDQARRGGVFKEIQVVQESFSLLIESICKYYCSVKNIKSDTILKVLILLIDAATLSNVKIISTAQKLFGMILATMPLDHIQKGMLNSAVNEYEKRTKCLLPRPPADAPKMMKTAPAKNRIDIDLDLEDEILEQMRDKNEQRKERMLPVSLRSGNIPIIARNMSKVDQMRAEFAKEMPKTVPVSKKRSLSQSVVGVSKPQRLDNANSSASETDIDGNDFSSLKSKYHQPTNNEPAPMSRSVKLIDVADTSTSATRRPSVKSGSTLYENDVNLVKQFHRTILKFELSNVEMCDEPNVSVVPGSFESGTHYISVFEPLLFIESRAQLAQSSDESRNDPTQSLRISGVSHVDDFHEVILQGDADADEGRSRVNEQDYLIIIMANKKDTLPGIVVQTSMKGGMFEAIVRLVIPHDKVQLQVEFREGVRLSFRKVGNVITSLREYTALYAVGSLSLAQHIFQPRCIPYRDSHNINSELEGLTSALNINSSQAKAIYAVVRNINPITLIQGPPGTGKTKTIESLLGVLLGRSYSGGGRGGKIMICAPSNAAIDEIVRRIRFGLLNDHGEKFMVRVLRVGSIDMISDAVKDLTIEAQVDKLMEATAGHSTELLTTQRKAHEDIRKRLSAAEMSCREDLVKSLKTNLWEAKENMRKNSKFIEDTRNQLKLKVLNDAQIVCCTLSSSGHDLLSQIEFEYVIIDEACQAVELSCLVPLQRNCRQCVLVGDPNQLPPTVISQMASVFSYEQSLFVRLQRQCPESVILLDTQYRMHPDISRFPNSYFYEGRLQDGPSMGSRNIRPWHSNKYLRPFLFFDVSGQEDRWQRSNGIESRSKMNEMEARIAVNLIAMLCSECPNLNMAGKIGVVTPYKDQRRALRRELSHRFGSDIAESVEVSTVDGFQGQEKEIIIFSCVRTGENKGIGFLNDTRRLNVALTRAKCSLFVLGKAGILVRNPIWKAMIEDAKGRDCFVPHDPRIWDEVERLRRLDNLLAHKKQNIEQVDLTNTKSKTSPRAKTPTAIQTAAQRRIMDQQRNSATPLGGITESRRLVIDNLLDRVHENQKQ